MDKQLSMRLIANAAIAVGLYLFARMIHGAANGFLVARLFTESQESAWYTAAALALALPLPFHVISVGLLLQRRWLPHFWARISFLAAVISGCWLGTALGFKIFLLS
jgi:hypothetical protein